jgi:hypothetical protein
VDIMPVLLGGGLRFFGETGWEQIRLERLRVLELPGGRTHLRYRIVKLAGPNPRNPISARNRVPCNSYETHYFIPTETGAHFMSCVTKREGEVPPELQGMFQQLWNEAFGGIKPDIENDIAKGTVTVAPNPNLITA